MKTVRNILVAAAAAAAFAATALPASAQARVSAGTLSCSVAPGVSFVFGSTRQVRCIYYGTNGVAERYIGEINRWGVDIGYTNAATMMWAVLAGTGALPAGTLAGDYAGVSAPVTWEEIDRGFRREEFTITSMPARIAEVGDLWTALASSNGVDLGRVSRYVEGRRR